MARIVTLGNRQVLIIPNSVYLNPSNSRGFKRGSNSTPCKNGGGE